MDIRMLGPVEVHISGKVLTALSPQQRHVIAALASQAGQTVPDDVLVDRLWDHASDNARRTLQVQVSIIRRFLRPAGLDRLISRRSKGYTLDIDPDRVDSLRFRSLLSKARDPNLSDPHRAMLAQTAIALWRNDPLSDIPGRWALGVREAMVAEYLEAAVLWADLQLRIGDASPLIGPLTDLVNRYPLVEPLSTSLILSLAATGHAAAALDRFAATRRTLADELGIDPGPDLLAAYQNVLRGKTQHQPPTKARTLTTEISSYLPHDLFGFVGRASQMQALDNLLSDLSARPTAPALAILSGPAGVGKTTLAVHWAHHHRRDFPDGVLYVDLHGFDETPATDHTEAVQILLNALGVEQRSLPDSLSDRTRIYHQAIERRNILLILDNARNAEQIRPLLQTKAGSLTIATSRNQLASLVVTKGARPVPVDLMDSTDSRALLERRIGSMRTAEDSEALGEIAELCGYLPLALTITSARASTRDSVSLSEVAKGLRGSGDSLDAFSDDPDSDLRKVFSWSYRTLSTEAAELFNLISVHPRTDLSTAAVASISGIPLPQTSKLLEELRRASMISDFPLSRWKVHDLLSAYGTERLHRDQTAQQILLAKVRMLDHYLYTAVACDRLLQPSRSLIDLPPMSTGIEIEDIENQRDALAWFDREHATLLAIIKLAAAGISDRHVVGFAWATSTYLSRRGYQSDWIECQLVGLSAAARLGDLRAHADAARGVARAYALRGRFELSMSYLLDALRNYKELGDSTGMAHAHLGIGWVHERRGSHRSALRSALDSRHLYRLSHHLTGQAYSLNNIASHLAYLKRYKTAIIYAQQALDIHRQINDLRGAADALDTLGNIYLDTGRCAHALVCYRQSASLYHTILDQPNEADTLIRIGGVYLKIDDKRAATEAWRAASSILDKVDQNRAQEVRSRIIELTSPSRTETRPSDSTEGTFDSTPGLSTPTLGATSAVDKP